MGHQITNVTANNPVDKKVYTLVSIVLEANDERQHGKGKGISETIDKMLKDINTLRFHLIQ
eukprot:TRINITY_DN5787_c0_g1_i1.p1 TRINITY_DN5787_c0_g1~~TRINITY_DN5787_c0_g1_i1.p1  ORF type:complete len:61 (+),score=6.62 TRINITY_DN5787_c0_g1_i1:139-321(+)